MHFKHMAQFDCLRKAPAPEYSIVNNYVGLAGKNIDDVDSRLNNYVVNSVKQYYISVP